MPDNTLKRHALTLIAVLISVIPPAAAILLYFPVWKSAGAVSVVSGFGILLLTLASVPILRLIGERFKSPSAHVMWLVLFIIFFALSKIAEQMVVISFVGFVSNLIASFIFRAARGRKNEA